MKPDRIECDEILLDQHVAIKSISSDVADLLRLNDFDPATRNEVIFIKERLDLFVEESLHNYHRFRP